MKFLRKHLYTILLIGAMGILVILTPIGARIKSRLSGILTEYRVANNQGEQLSLEEYDWKLVDRQGRPFDFKALKDEVVLINFWATWCQPCVQEMPSLEKLYQAYGNKIRFLFVAQDEKIKVDAFMAKKAYDFPVYYSTSKKPGLFISKSIPTTYILDKNGQIILAKTGANDWYDQETRTLLDRLL